jgi:hypothetical protein
MMNSATQFLETHGFGALPLPSDVGESMRECGEDCIASVALDGEWRAGASAREVATAWLEAGSVHRGGRCEFVGSGVASNQLQLVFESPRCGIFIAKSVSAVVGDEAQTRTRIDGVFELMRYVVDAVEAARFWPDAKRLAIVDDDREGLVYWAWVDALGAGWDDLTPDATGWITALLSVEGLGQPTA